MDQNLLVALCQNNLSIIMPKKGTGVQNGLLLPCCCSGEKNNLASDMEVYSFITTVQGGSGCWFQWIISILSLKRNKKRWRCWALGRPADQLLSLLKKYKICVQDRQLGCCSSQPKKYNNQCHCLHTSSLTESYASQNQAAYDMVKCPEKHAWD